jgi:hypothetical protein
MNGSTPMTSKKSDSTASDAIRSGLPRCSVAAPARVADIAEKERCPSFQSK